MIPVKWMPPESFMDGVFCNATDVWSFGILLWEIFGFGFTPYPGKSNQEVMQYVISGGRLDRPNSATPDMIWDLTQWCWHPMPKQRPTFTEIVRQLGRCLQNKSVLNSPLPRFSANASASNSGGLGNEVHLPFRGQQSLATIQPLHHYLHPVGGVGPTSDMTDFSNGTGGTSSSLIRRSQNSATQSGNNTCSTASTLLTSVSGAPTIGQTHGTNIHQPHLSQKDANSTILQRQLVERQTLGIVKIRGQALKRLSNMLRREPNVPRFSFRYDLPSTSAPSSQSKSGNWIHRLRFSIAKSNKNHQKLPGPPSKSSVNRPPIISSSLPLPPPPTASSSSTASNARSIGNQNNKSDAILPSTSSASNRNLHDDRDFDRRRRKSSDELLLQVNQLNTNQIDRSEK